MGSNQELTSVVLITQNAKLIKEIQRALDQESGFNLLKSIQKPDQLEELIQVAHPGIILLDFQLDKTESILRVIDEIASRFLSAAVVTILPETQVQLSDQVILAGSRAILLYPFSEENLVTTLKRVRELLFRNLGISHGRQAMPVRAKKNRCLVVYSPKGGVGCTSVAINLAIALHQQVKEKVLLVDGRHALGHVALMLNLRTGNSITDLISNVGKLDEALINQVVVDHSSGISILASPMGFDKGHEFRPEDLFKVIQVLKTIYPNLIVDGGSHLDDNLVTYMDMADGIILVVNPNLASLRDGRQFLNFSQTLSYSEEKVMIVLNQAGHKADVKLSDIEKALHSTILGTIPVDEDMMLSCLNEGVPIILKKPNHPISKAIKTLSTAVTHSISSLSSQSTDQINPSSDVLRKSSYLG